MSRWEVLQSLLRVPKFICIHLSWQSKTWPLITAWLLWKGGQNETPAALLRIWQAWGEVPDDKTHVDLLVINSSWPTCVTETFPAACRYSSVSFIYADPNGGTRSRRESWVLFWRGVTESGAPDSSLSFLNRLSVGKAVADGRPGVELQTQRWSRATARLQRFNRVDFTQKPPSAAKGEAYEWTAVTHGRAAQRGAAADTPTAAPRSLPPKHLPRYLPAREMMMTGFIYHSGDSLALLQVSSLSFVQSGNLFFFFFDEIVAHCSVQSGETRVRGEAPGSAPITPSEVTAGWGMVSAHLLDENAPKRLSRSSLYG